MTNTYRNISIKTEFADIIEKFVRQHPQYGYRSIAQFLEDAARERLEELKGFQTTSDLEHFNLDEDGVKIRDLSLATSNSPHGLIVDVAFKPKGIRCDYCQTNDCRHIQFALSEPAIQKVIRKRIKDGWDLPEV